MDTIEELSKSRFFSVKDGTLVLNDQAGAGRPGRTPGAAPGATPGAAPTPAPTALTGTVDNKYRIIGLLGEGGMGAVYRAHHLGLTKEVALKTFRSAEQSEEARARFRREALALAKLAHKNIVQVFDYGQTEDGSPYYTMEYLSGQSLAERIRHKGPLSIGEAAELFVPACQGLALAHSKGIVHRDLKPSNLFIESSSSAGGKGVIETIKIVDFGIASLTEQTADGQRLTTFGTIFGSPLYMSPEQSIGEKIGERSDIYSLGCALFETLTGVPPFHGETAFATIMMHQKSPQPSLSQAADGKPFPAAIEQMVATMLAKNPERRQASMEQVADELQRASLLSKMSSSQAADGSPAVNESPAGNGSPAVNGSPGTNASPDVNDVPALPEKPPSYKRVALISGLALLTLLAVGVVANYYLSFFGRAGANSTSPKIYPTAPVNLPTEQATEKSPAGAITDQTIPAGRMPIRRTEDLENGKKVIRLDFPTECEIGEFWAKGDHHTELNPIESYKWFADAPPTFLPSVAFMADPTNFRVFHDGDLLGINFTRCKPSQVTNTALNEAVKLKGLKNLDFSKCNPLTPRDLSILADVTSTSFISFNYSKTSGAVLATYPRLMQLDCIRFSGCPHVSALLAALTKSTTVTRLQLENAHLQPEDYKTIGAIANLEVLTLSGNGMTMADLKQLQTLKKLTTIFADDCEVTIEVEPFLKTMSKHSLTTAQFSDKLLTPAEKVRLRRILPELKFASENTEKEAMEVDKSMMNLAREKGF